MKILLLGNTGQLGWELNRTLPTLGTLIAMDFPQIDMSNPENILSIVRQFEPNLIINATAYTNVDKAESEPDLAMAINRTGPGILAEEAKRLGSGLIHYSTDYVFDGRKGDLYLEEDKPNPLSVYGETKLAGEMAVRDIGGPYLTFRTSWVYSLRRPSFVTKVLEWAQKHEMLKIVDDQISTPTWARSLAEATAQVIAQGKSDPVGYISENTGLYHLSGGGFCSRYEWAKAVLDFQKTQNNIIVREILPAKSTDFLTAAERPLKSALSCEKFEKTFHLPLPNWKEVLGLAFDSA